MVGSSARDHEAHGDSDPADYRNDEYPHRIDAAGIRHCDNREHRSGDELPNYGAPQTANFARIRAAD